MALGKSVTRQVRDKISDIFPRGTLIYQQIQRLLTQFYVMLKRLIYIYQ